MSHDFVEVDIWPPDTSSSVREEIGFLQILAFVSLILKTFLLLSSCSLLIISVLFQVDNPVSWQSIASISTATVLVPITCISLVADSLHFRMKFFNYRSLLILLVVPFWCLGSLTLLFELTIAGFLIILITQYSGITVYLLIANHVISAPLTLASLVLSMVAWRLISMRQRNDGVTDVRWSSDDVITYTPRY